MAAVFSAPAAAMDTEGCAGNTHRIETLALSAAELGRTVAVTVYLPPGYDCARIQRYPVFYFNDGQELFDWHPAMPGIDADIAAQIVAASQGYGTWRLETQLEQAFIDNHLPPMIVVGASSDSGPRSRDLAPVPWAGSVEARGEHYGSFLARTVVPLIDERYRTRANRACRGIGGASLGGVSALHIGLAHPQEFGLVLALSPLLGDPAIAEHMATLWHAPRLSLASTLVIDFDDTAAGSADRQWMAALVDGESPANHRPILRQTTGGRHTIGSWAERVMPGMVSLMAGRCGDRPS